jgi:predicted pyridoxine 5'-phosphate oxidase superfamily flavin-nucleotide-binding protein
MPTATTVRFPSGYGKATRTIGWEEVRARLEAAPAYWLSTARVDGRPHVVPVDGIWVDDVWWYGGAPGTVHVRTVEANPHAVMHLPDPMQAVIVEGVVFRVAPTAELAQRMADAANEKYAHYGLKNDAATYASALGLFPTRVLAWSAFPADATRFQF